MQDAFSSALMGLEALLISISPAANFLNPPPVPERPTDIFTLGFVLLYSLATAWEISSTVLEPSAFISPTKPPLVGMLSADFLP